VIEKQKRGLPGAHASPACLSARRE